MKLNLIVALAVNAHAVKLSETIKSLQTKCTRDVLVDDFRVNNYTPCMDCEIAHLYNVIGKLFIFNITQVVNTDLKT
jgi:hypothetical protein